MECVSRMPQAINLAIDESSFTGETEPSIKDVQVVLKPNGHTSMKNIAFMGTLVRYGRGKVRNCETLVDEKTIKCGFGPIITRVILIHRVSS